jgi:hypothetical protein
MTYGCFGMIAVQVRFDFFKWQVMIFGHKTFYTCYTAGDVAGRSINLDPVAGRDDYPLDNPLKLEQFPQRLFNLVGRKGHLFTDFNCSSFVREADNDDIHD